MNVDSPATKELMEFLCSEMRRDAAECVSSNARVLTHYCTQASLVPPEGSFPLLVIWVGHWWSYQALTGKRTMAAMAETAGEFTEHILGWEGPCRVVVGRVNCYRRQGT